jgi:hypothetical protein
MSQETDIPFQNIVEKASTKGYVDKLLSFLELHLPDFTDEFVVNSSINENDITELLYKHLTKRKRFNKEDVEYPFDFQPEKPQKKREAKGHPKRVDIAANLLVADRDLQVIFTIEAKKLPTDKENGIREKEYVNHTNSKSKPAGGIQRYKEELHGIDDQGHLIPRNGIIAYTSGKSHVDWFDKVNVWIDECSWGKQERLVNKYYSKVSKFTSNHKTTSNRNVCLEHFWIEVSN